MSGAPSDYIFISHASADNPRLRPVLAALLDDGAPLWFDKPYKLAMDDAQFAGCLIHGQKWADGVEAALMGAAGVVVFASEAAAKSGEVRYECGLAQGQKLNFGERFVLFSALIGADSDASEATITRGLHAFPTYVEQASGDIWRLTRDGQVGVQLLSAALKAHLAKRRGLAAPARRTAPEAQADQRDYAAPYLVDRLAQRDAALNVLVAPDRPPVLIVHGPEPESPTRFGTVNLPRQVIAAHPFFPRGGATAALLRPRWPTADPANGEGFALGLARNVLEKLQSARDIDDPAVWNSAARLKAEVAKALGADGVVRLVVGRFEPEVASARALRAAVTAWTDFWDDFPFEHLKASARFLVLPLMEVIHPRAEQGRGWTPWRKSDGFREVMESPAFDAELKRRSGRTTPQLLPALAPVTPRLARDWIYADPLFDACGDDDREQLARDLEQLFPTAGQARQPQLPMREWAQLAKPILRAADIE